MMLVGADIKVGRCYRGKRPANSYGLVNDRSVLYVSSLGNYVQYDSPSVAPGRKFPRVTMEAFLKWAERDVTKELPGEQFQSWSAFRSA